MFKEYNNLKNLRESFSPHFSPMKIYATEEDKEMWHGLARRVESWRRDGTRGREKGDIGREVMGEGGAEREARPFFDPRAGQTGTNISRNRS